MMQPQFDFALAAPEIILLVLGMLTLLVDAASSHPERKPTLWLSLLTLAVLSAVTLAQWSAGTAGASFHGLYVADELSHLTKLASYLAVAVTLIYGHAYAREREMLRGGELYVLALFALLGQMVM